MRLTQAFTTASVTGANYCPDAEYLIILIVRHIGRLQVEKRVSLFVQT